MKEDNIVTITLDDGEEIEFIEIAYFMYQGRNYSLLQPAYSSDEEDENCIYVFEVVTENDEENFILLEDCDNIIAEYERLLAKQAK